MNLPHSRGYFSDKEIKGEHGCIYKGSSWKQLGQCLTIKQAGNTQEEGASYLMQEESGFQHKTVRRQKQIDKASYLWHDNTHGLLHLHWYSQRWNVSVIFSQWKSNTTTFINSIKVLNFLFLFVCLFLQSSMRPSGNIHQHRFLH